MGPDRETKVIPLRDGRDLAWTEAGDRDGTPIMAFHGSPGRGRDFAVYDGVAGQRAVRLIAIDRPGYGHSGYAPGRRLADWPADIAQLADHLRIPQFGVIGHSAGGPHALACARFLPGRVSSCGVLSGPAPQAEEPLTEGMLVTNRIQTAIYRHWPRRLDPLGVALWHLTKPLVSPALRYGRRHPEKGLDRLEKMLPPCDWAVVLRPQMRPVILGEVATFTDAVLRTSVQDMAIGIRDWGFRLDEIESPVHIWHGNLDRNIPVAHAHRLAEAIPGSRLHLCPGEGHWLLVDHMAEILETLAA